jgi:hypothetical protein
VKPKRIDEFGFYVCNIVSFAV